jgi:alpha/beta superfamily hydrolase
MPHEERITFTNPRRQRLVGILHRPATEPAAAVILCHGMESSKESEKLATLSRQLSEKGIFALRFDFAGSGESEGKFEEMTYSGEVEDLRAGCILRPSSPLEAQAPA